jgi:hypothetical protein
VTSLLIAARRGLLDDTIDERGEWRCVVRLTADVIGEITIEIGETRSVPALTASGPR